MLSSLMKYVWFLYGLRHFVITTTHNLSKTAISSWHNQFKTFNEDKIKPKALIWLSLIKLVQWSLQFDVHKFSSYHTLHWMNLTTGWLVPAWFTTMVGYFKGDQPVSKPPVHVISHFQSAKRFCLNSILLSLTVSWNHKAWTNPPRKRS